MPSKFARDELLTELQRLADELGKTPTIADMKQRGGYSERPITSRFGSWNKALEAAGLFPNKRQHIPREALLDELRRLADDFNRSPGTADVRYDPDMGPVVR